MGTIALELKKNQFKKNLEKVYVVDDVSHKHGKINFKYFIL
jgi:hypothetical protein